MNKVTDREQKIQTFDNGSQFPMNRERIGQPTTHPVLVAQGTMNPIQRNTIERIELSKYSPVTKKHEIFKEIK